MVTRIGLISDTHRLLRPEAIQFLAGCDHVVHAGDVGAQAILDDLARLAPLTVVRGNNDDGPWAEALPETATLSVEDVAIHVIHDLAELAIDPPAAGVRVVVSGHSHKPLVQERDGVLYVNPGSAGPRRFTLPISIGEMIVNGGEVTVRLVELDLSTPR